MAKKHFQIYKKFTSESIKKKNIERDISTFVRLFGFMVGYNIII